MSWKGIYEVTNFPSPLYCEPSARKRKFSASNVAEEKIIGLLSFCTILQKSIHNALTVKIREHSYVLQFWQISVMVFWIQCIQKPYFVMLVPQNSITLTNYPFEKIPAINFAKHRGKRFCLFFQKLFSATNPKLMSQLSSKDVILGYIAPVGITSLWILVKF